MATPTGHKIQNIRDKCIRAQAYQAQCWRYAHTVSAGVAKVPLDTWPQCQEDPVWSLLAVGITAAGGELFWGRRRAEWWGRGGVALGGGGTGGLHHHILSFMLSCAGADLRMLIGGQHPYPGKHPSPYSQGVSDDCHGSCWMQQ